MEPVSARAWSELLHAEVGTLLRLAGVPCLHIKGPTVATWLRNATAASCQSGHSGLREGRDVRAVIQRVLSASVTVDGQTMGAFDEPGLLVYFAVTHGDGPAEIVWTARKIWDLRLLREERSLSDTGAPVLVVSQFTLYGEARKGRRPTWQAAAPGPVSEPAYDAVCAELERLGARVERGVFGADMMVSSVNDGPITLVLDSPPREMRPRER